MRPGGSSGDMNSVTHGYFAPKERACLRIQPALKKKKKETKKSKAKKWMEMYMLAKAQRLRAGAWELSKPFQTKRH